MDQFRIVQSSDTEFFVQQKTSEIKRCGLFGLQRKEVVKWERCAIQTIEKTGFYLYPKYETFPSLEAARKWITDTRKYPIYHEAEPDSIGRYGPEGNIGNVEIKVM